MLHNLKMYTSGQKPQWVVLSIILNMMLMRNVNTVTFASWPISSNTHCTLYCFNQQRELRQICSYHEQIMGWKAAAAQDSSPISPLAFKCPD
jgi:hypothetical protein